MPNPLRIITVTPQGPVTDTFNVARTWLNKSKAFAANDAVAEGFDVNRFRPSSAVGKLVRAGNVAGLFYLGTEAVISGVKYYLDNNPNKLSPEEAELAAQIIDSSYDTKEVYDNSLRYLEHQLNNGSLSFTDNGFDMNWDPTPVPVPVNNVDSTLRVEFDDNNRLLFKWFPPELDSPEPPKIDIGSDLNIDELPFNDLAEFIDEYGDILDMEFDYLTDLPFSPELTIALNSGLNQALDLSISVNPLADAATRFENRLKNDAKDKSGNMYLALLHFINKTWGRVTELDDFNLIVQNNVTIAEDIRLRNGSEIPAGTKINELSLADKVQLFKELAQNEPIDLDLDADNLILEVFLDDLMDTAIGLATGVERDLIDKYGIRDYTGNLTDYGNISTWISRVRELLDSINQNGENHEIQQPTNFLPAP